VTRRPVYTRRTALNVKDRGKSYHAVPLCKRLFHYIEALPGMNARGKARYYCVLRSLS